MAACAIWASTIQNIATNSTVNAQQPRQWQRVDRAARDIGHGDDPVAVRALVNAVLADNGIDEKIVATSGSVPDRLVAAEMRFQKGEAPGIPEESVVKAVNQLALRFNAPTWAHTDLKELRRLRLEMLTVYPGLIGRGSAATRDDTKPHFERTMSPVEAFHVTATLIFQKITNPAFQFSRQEIDAAPQQDKATLSQLTEKVKRGDRTQEIIGAIRETSKSMSLRDVLDLSEQTLDQLGIPR